MGLESHVDRELQRAASGLVRGEDYWFCDGLRTATKVVADAIVQHLENSGEFGPARIINVEKIDSLRGGYLIEFGIYKQWFTPNKKYPSYSKYVKAFKAGK